MCGSREQAPGRCRDRGRGVRAVQGVLTQRGHAVRAALGRRNTGLLLNKGTLRSGPPMDPLRSCPRTRQDNNK